MFRALHLYALGQLMDGGQRLLDGLGNASWVRKLCSSVKLCTSKGRRKTWRSTQAGCRVQDTIRLSEAYTTVPVIRLGIEAGPLAWGR